MSVIFSIVVFIFVLGLVIVIHELGHFIMAKRANVLCHEFSLGMGPILWSRRRKETLYTIRAIPIGGYVMMAGEEVEDEVVKVGKEVRLIFDDFNNVEKIILDHENEKYDKYEKVTVTHVDLRGENNEPLYLNDYTVKRDAFYVFKNRELQIAPYERSFESKTKMERFLAIFAGPFMNFILAIFVFIIINLFMGFPVMDNTVLGSIGEGLPSYGVLEEGDEIVSINGELVNDWDDISSELSSNVANRLVEFDIIRDGSTETVTVTPTIAFNSLGFRSVNYLFEPLVVDEIDEDSIAFGAGFEVGDKILKVDGIDIANWYDIAYLVGDNVDETPMSFTVTRDDNDLIIDVTPNIIFESLGFRNIDDLVDSLIIDDVNKGTFASEAGFVGGDEILTVDGITVLNWEDLTNIVSDNIAGDKMVFTVLRDGIVKTLTIEEPYDKEILDYSNVSAVDSFVGISPEYKFDFFRSFTHSFTNTKDSAMMIFSTIKLLFNSDKVGVSDLAGPVGIYSITSSALSGGIFSLLGWIALLSVNLGVINLLPIPALDGGRLVFLGYEAITTKKPNRRIENTLHYAMYLMLLGLFVFITFNDILRLFNLK